MSRTFDCVCMQCMLIVCQRRRRRNEIRKQNKKSNMKVRNGAVWPYNTLFHLVLVQHFHLCEYLLFRFNFVYSTEFCVRVCVASHINCRRPKRQANAIESNCSIRQTLIVIVHRNARDATHHSSTPA